MDIEKSLRDLGLKKYEAAAYLNISRRGVAEASTIYKEAKIPFGKIYETLGTLENKGLIEVQNTRPKRYKAKKPKLAFNNLFKEKKEYMEMNLERTRVIITQIEEELDKINVKHRKEKIFWTTAIGDETGELSRCNFEEAEKEICLLIYSEYQQNHTNPIHENTPAISIEVIKATLRGVKVKALLSESFALGHVNDFENINPPEETVNNIEVRVTNIPLPSHFIIIDSEKVVLRVDDPVNPNNILAMTKIWDKKLADKLNKKFNEIWEEAKPFKLI
jgi:sugar-specific transcriptional regulator TrmB